MVGTVALCTLIGVGWGLLAAALHGVIYVFFLSSSINGLCHTRGYRTFDNTATNIPWLALLTGGEGFHNNHHGFPRSPKCSVGSGEFDPSWRIIRVLTRLNLARPYQTIEQIGEGRQARLSTRHAQKRAAGEILGNLQRGRLNGLRGAIDRRVQLCSEQNRQR